MTLPRHHREVAPSQQLLDSMRPRYISMTTGEQNIKSKHEGRKHSGRMVQEIKIPTEVKGAVEHFVVPEGYQRVGTCRYIHGECTVPHVLIENVKQGGMKNIVK